MAKRRETKAAVTQIPTAHLAEARKLAAVIYGAWVERCAMALRAKFEDGTLRGFVSGDAGSSPLFRLQDECEKRFIRSPQDAAIVLLGASRSSLAPAEADFDRPEHIATVAMAVDVLNRARANGWSKPQDGEEPTFKANRKARRAA